MGQGVRTTPMRALGLLIALLPATASAEAAGSPASAMLRVEGNVLVYDTETGLEDGEITHDDIGRMRELLRDNPAVTLLRLNSGGGSVYASEDMARVVMDFDLDTEVDGTCTSSCVVVFLGGKSRTLTRGSTIGLHSRWWSPEDIASYYEDNKAEEGWSTPFEMASWIYEDTQAEIHRSLAYVVSRGVDPRFAIEMHAPREQMWYPARSELEAAGVLRP